MSYFTEPMNHCADWRDHRLQAGRGCAMVMLAVKAAGVVDALGGAAPASPFSFTRVQERVA